MLTFLGGLADVVRDLMRTRTTKGRSRAKARGAHIGRPARLALTHQQEVRQRLIEGETHAGLARSSAVDISIIQRIKKRVAPESRWAGVRRA